ncbi:hypothetical protein F8388_025087 [Cannabis sativa]|uniref:C3H1-type domain-containing protein n=1 Tax=Cannabis sativa TaxID=3483 RepID=A0A7J6FJB8_CANSA|nr:hypothetical protein F8388_025087 [Cannabis sativa]
MEFRKRGRPEGSFNGNGGFKKSKQGMSSLVAETILTAGCPFGESCHFLHYVPGGYNAVAQMMNLAPPVPPPSGNMGNQAPTLNGSSASSVKTRVCNRFNSVEGCKFGDKCHFAHGEWEIGKVVAPSHDDPRPMPPMPNRYTGRMETPQPPPGLTSSFGASATVKISVDASLAGAIIGKGGVNSKQICRQTGAKLAIREHESDPNLRNIELEGTFEQIKEASAMVRELIVNVSMSGPGKPSGGPGHGHGHGHGGHGHSHGPGGQSHDPGGQNHGPSGNNYKTKLCDNFTKGTCTFGDRCHFAHGATELRKTGL